MIIVNAVVFLIGALGCAFANTIGMLIGMRILIGIAIGITSYVVPMYIAEVSPSRKRGALVTLNQLMITIGILVSYITDYLLSNDKDLSSWRDMFFIGVFPAIILLVGMFFLPESPRWLIKKGRWEEGKKVLSKVEDDHLIDQTIENIRKDLELASAMKGSTREILQPWLRPALIITIGIFFSSNFQVSIP